MNNWNIGLERESFYDIKGQVMPLSLQTQRQNWCSSVVLSAERLASSGNGALYLQHGAARLHFVSANKELDRDQAR